MRNGLVVLRSPSALLLIGAGLMMRASRSAGNRYRRGSFADSHLPVGLPESQFNDPELPRRFSTSWCHAWPPDRGGSRRCHDHAAGVGNIGINAIVLEGEATKQLREARPVRRLTVTPAVH